MVVDRSTSEVPSQTENRSVEAILRHLGMLHSLTELKPENEGVNCMSLWENK